MKVKLLKSILNFLQMPRVIICKRFAYIEDRIISRNYTQAKIDDFLWRVYLSILLLANGQRGRTYTGRLYFNRHYGNCSNSAYQKAIEILKSYGLIKVEYKPTRKYKTPLIAPVWDESSGTFLPQDKIIGRVQHNLLLLKLAFALVPFDCLDALLRDKALSVTAIRLALKLYKYYNPDLFGGLDPNLIHFKNGEIHYAERLFEDLGIHEDEIETYLNLLDKYFYLQKTVVIIEQFDHEERIMPAEKFTNPLEVEQVFILCPVYQLEVPEYGPDSVNDN